MTANAAARRKAARQASSANGVDSTGSTANNTAGIAAGGASESGASDGAANADLGGNDTDPSSTPDVPSAATSGCFVDTLTQNRYGVSLANLPQVSPNATTANYDFITLAKTFEKFGATQCAPSIASARIGLPFECDEMTRRIACEGNIGYFIPDTQTWSNSDAFTSCLLIAGADMVSQPNNAQANSVCPDSFAGVLQTGIISGDGTDGASGTGNDPSTNKLGDSGGLNPIAVVVIGLGAGLATYLVFSLAVKMLQGRAARNANAQAPRANGPSLWDRARNATANIAAHMPNLPAIPAMPHFGASRRTPGDGLRPLVLVDRLRLGEAEAPRAGLRPLQLVNRLQAGDSEAQIGAAPAQDSDARSIRSDAPSYHTIDPSQDIELQFITPVQNRDLV